MFDFLVACAVYIPFIYIPFILFLLRVYYTFADYIADICAVMPALTKLLDTNIVIITQLTCLLSKHTEA